MHPGTVLRKEFLEPLGLKPYTLARRIGVDRQRLERIVREEKGVSADTALRLGAYFRTTGAFWLNLQTKYELEMRLCEPNIARELRQIKEHTEFEREMAIARVVMKQERNILRKLAHK
jgi:addiction module HigA family antidote